MPERRWSNAVVVGSSGAIGGALTAALLETGAGTVHALSRTGAGPTGALAGRIDLLDEASIAAAASRAAERGPVDLVLVASGLLHGDGVRPERGYRELSADSLARLYAVNVIGPAMVAKHFLPHLPRQGRAAYACLSARVGSLGDNRLGGWHGYRASKAALNMLIRNLAIELARTHPEAVCIGLHPGTVDSALSAPFQRGVAPEKLFTPEFAAERLLAVLDQAGPEASGGVYAWDGALIAP